MPERDAPRVLLVNPWIHDFAAYDFWAQPLGLLTLGGLLRQAGLTVTYLDCLDRFHPRSRSSGDPRARYGRGPYLKTPLPRPAGLQDVPRTFSRYGIPPALFTADLHAVGRPDLILVTSMMTYWYPGVFEAIARIREVYPDVPLILGGIYASLCPTHAANGSGADRVVTGPGEQALFDLVREYTACDRAPAFDPDDLDTFPRPAFDLQRTIAYLPLLTSRGCPFDCAYCAARRLNPKRMRRRPEAVVDEIAYWRRDHGVSDYVLYDDAFLVDAERHAVPLLEGLVAAGLRVRLHTPNALHIRAISARTARLMFAAGFTTLRLGLETAAFESRGELDDKVTAEEFTRAVARLKDAGFRGDQVGAYLLVGLPGQDAAAVERSIRLVRASGITPIPAYYTPIPHTALWDQAVRSSRYDLEADPVFSNNAVMPCRQEKFSWEELSTLKALAHGA